MSNDELLVEPLATEVSDRPMPLVDGVTHAWATVDGLRMHYAEAGEGEPLVLLHGWPQHWWSWRHLIGPLSKHYRVICPDIRGMGWSEGSQHGSSWQGIARDLVDLLDGIGVGRFRLIGHDWGLVTGYQTCFNWPDRVQQFIGLGGVHLWSADGAPARLYLAPWHVYLIALLGDTASRRMRITERCLPAWRHNGAFTDAETETYMAIMREPRCERATRQFDRNFVAHELPHYALHYRHLRLRVPTLLLNGEHDPLTQGVPPTYRKYADDMRLELVPDCGHFVAEEQPEWLLDRALKFLES